MPPYSSAVRTNRNYPPHELADNQRINVVRGFFESQIGPLALPDTRVRDVAGAATRSTDETAPGLADAVEPDWEKATVWEADNGVITEVPAKLKKSVDYTVLVEKSGRQVSLTTQKPNVRVLVVEPRDGGATYCMLATFLPDKGWGGKARELAVGGKPGDYSGLLVYSLPDGTSAWGLRYDGGEANHVIFFDNGHADRQDPDIRIAIGSSGGATTRTSYNYIETVTCVGHRSEDSGSNDSNISFYDALAMMGGGELQEKRYWIENGGGGGGGGGSNSASLAKKIFKNTKMTEAQWKQVDSMVTKILNDCMGGNLYNALVGKGLNLTYNPNAKDSEYAPSTKTVTLKSLADYGVLTQELFHAYQAHNPATLSGWNNKICNIEVEAHLAQYRLLYESPPTGYDSAGVWKAHQNNDFNMAIAHLDEYLDDKCQMQSGLEGLFKGDFSQAMSSYKKYNPNSSMSTNDNDLAIRNLQELSKNC